MRFVSRHRLWSRRTHATISVGEATRLAIKETRNHSRHEAPEKAWIISFIESSIGPNAYHMGDRPVRQRCAKKGIFSLTPLIMYLRTMLYFSINFLISCLANIYLIGRVVKRGFFFNKDSFTWNEEAARAFSHVLMHTKSLSQVLNEVVLVLVDLCLDMIYHVTYETFIFIKERASREPLCDLPLAESPVDVALVLLPYRGLPFPNESCIQVVTLAKALSKSTGSNSSRHHIQFGANGIHFEQRYSHITDKSDHEERAPPYPQGNRMPPFDIRIWRKFHDTRKNFLTKHKIEEPILQ
uniref:Uncharacterized protein n=1 Tax=Tanacetum cinerariifolium TaxID=118510 RepID=A0A699IXX7_TANCI|nr:hypothetical protein [Tanacetum cinerariifolium]